MLYRAAIGVLDIFDNAQESYRIHSGVQQSRFKKRLEVIAIINYIIIVVLGTRARALNCFIKFVI